MIPKSDVQQFFGHILLNTQIRINHDACPAGVDTRKRLYIKHIDKGFIYYCHNCSDWGATFNNDKLSKSYLPLAVIRALKEEDQKIIITKASIIQSRRYDIEDGSCSKLPPQARKWLAKYNCLNDDFVGNDIYWLPDIGRLAINIYNFNTERVGTQYRKVNDTEYTCKASPKYLLSKNKGSVCGVYMNKSYCEQVRHFVITEDLLSAKKIEYVTGGQVAGVSLLGTNPANIDPMIPIFHQLKGTLPPNSLKILIWLDPDLAGYKATMKVFKKLLLYGFIPGNEIMYIASSDGNPTYSYHESPKEHGIKGIAFWTKNCCFTDLDMNLFRETVNDEKYMVDIS